jgi:hypothetical protein
MTPQSKEVKNSKKKRKKKEKKRFIKNKTTCVFINKKTSSER